MRHPVNKLTTVATPVEPRRVIPIARGVILHNPIDLDVSLVTVVANAEQVLLPLRLERKLFPRIKFGGRQGLRVVRPQTKDRLLPVRGGASRKSGYWLTAVAGIAAGWD
jgi:hypothetical protein